MAKRTTVLSKAVQSAAGVSDRDLLRRFADDADQAAFAAVVNRHSPLVYGVCERVLRSAADADDATQAVFLVLAKKAKGQRWQASIANWLYTTARKVAQNAKLAAVRRSKREGVAAVPESVPPTEAMTGRELLAALDDELDKLAPRYREPLVLCYLQGLTRDDAAARLGVAVPALNKQLERGRKKLADALAARGCALGVLLLAVAATSARTNAAESVLTAVAGQPSAAAVALAQGFTMNAVVSRVKLTALAVVGLLALGVGAAAMPAPADPPKADAKEKPKADPPDAKAITVRGTVIGPDGKPMGGVAINTSKPGKTQKDKPTVEELAKTAADGSFSVTLEPNPPGRPEMRQIVAVKAGYGADWVNVPTTDSPVSLKLATDDVPVKGRVTDLEGKAVGKATVRVKGVAMTPTGDMTRIWEVWSRSPYQALQHASKTLFRPDTAGLPEGVTADADGKFEITGVGRGRLLALEVAGTGIETAGLRVVTDPAFDPTKVDQPNSTTMPGGLVQPGPALYAPTFTHAGKPSQPIVGTVTDAGSGKPLAGIQVTGNPAGSHWSENHATAKTDADGKYTLHGVAKTDKVSLFVYTGENGPYLPFYTTVAGKPGLTEIAADLKVLRGVRVKGKVVEAGSGKPVFNAAVRYDALADNKLYAERMADKRTASGTAWTTDKEGKFEFTALPGAGIVSAQGETFGRERGAEFTQVRVAKADLPRADMAHLNGLGETFSAADGHIITLFSLSGYTIIEPKATDETVEVTITFDRGKSVSGKVVDADGKLADGVTAYKLEACYSVPRKLTGGQFTAIALEKDHPRTVLFVDEAKKLSASIDLKGDEKEVTVKLQPWGTLAGRLLDTEGKPLAGAKVSVSAKQGIQHIAFNTVMRERTATTDADGKYALDVPAGSVEYMLGFSLKNKPLDTGYRPDSTGHTAKPGETTQVGDKKVRE